MTEQDKQMALLNLVSRGVPMAEAKLRLGIESPEPTTKPVPAPPQADEADELRAKLTELGVKFHPHSKVETLKRKLEEAELL